VRRGILAVAVRRDERARTDADVHARAPARADPVAVGAATGRTDRPAHLRSDDLDHARDPRRAPDPDGPAHPEADGGTDREAHAEADPQADPEANGAADVERLAEHPRPERLAIEQ
jgi:hypothetical protein